MLHTTKYGNTMPICTLSDEHLYNIIKMPFKAFLKPDEEWEDLYYWIYGENPEKMTPEIFENILEMKSMYIIEALKRDSLREDVLNLLGSFNPIFNERSKTEFRF